MKASILSVFVLLMDIGWAFNVDSDDANRIQYTVDGGSGGDTNSFFGYSIALFQKLANARLIIGAPRFNERNGALFSCQINSNSCRQLNAFKSDTNTSRPGDSLSKGELLGISISTTESSVTTCASLARFKSTHKSCIDDPEANTLCLHRRNYFMGRCPVFNQDLQFQYSDVPCYTSSGDSPHPKRYGNCMLGYGQIESFNNDGKLYQFLTAPGTGKYSGAVVATVDGQKNSNFVNVINVESDQLFLDNRQVKQDPTLEYTDQHALVGYSSTKGNFTGEALPGMASGAPRSRIYDGEVIIYQYRMKNGTATPEDLRDDSELTVISRLPNPVKPKGGPSQFGASMASIDINGDGYDDLAVGAPLFSNTVGNRIGHDEGRVFVFINNQKGIFKFEKNMTLEGENQESARFGSTVVNIGDINGDGTDDLAIGAPWGGKDGNGAVYIYNVRLGKVLNKPSQVLQSPVNSGTFGYSIAAALIDTRVYPVLAVGAPESGRVFLFKAKTIITLEDNLWIDRVTIPTDKSNCKYENIEYQCITFRANLKDKSTNAPINFDVEITFQSDVRSTAAAGRAFIYDKSTEKLVEKISNNVTFQRGGEIPFEHTIYISIDKDTNFESPVRLTTSYKTINTNNNCKDGPCAILDQFGSLNGFAVVSYLRQCGTDQICDVDLDITSSEIRVKKGATAVLEPLYIGSFNDEIKLIAKVTNRNESAYQAKMSINYHEDFGLLQISVNGRNIIPEYNGELINGTGNLVKFLLDNPILEGEEVNVEAQFIIRSLPRPKFFEYPFHLTVNSTGNEGNETTNVKTINLPMGIQSCVRVSLDVAEQNSARNQAPKLLYDHLKTPVAKPLSAQQAGPNIEYTILIQNSGRVPIDNMSIDITLVDRVRGQNVVYVSDLSIDGESCQLNEINVGKLYGVQNEPNENKTDSRRKRRAAGETDTRPPILNCLNGHCQTMSCNNIINFPVDGIRRLRLSMAVYLEALQRFQSNEMVIVVSTRFGGQFGSIITQAKECPGTIDLRQPFGKLPRIGEDGKRVEWWIVLVAVVGALILLAIFCVVLYRIGFFKRDRPEDTTPLNIHHVETYHKKPHNGDVDGYESD